MYLLNVMVLYNHKLALAGSLPQQCSLVAMLENHVNTWGHVGMYPGQQDIDRCQMICTGKRGIFSCPCQ